MVGYMTLRRTDLLDNPFAQLAQWLAHATASGEHEPTAMSLATSTPAGSSSLRTVLMKAIDDRGVVFYTDYTSRKSIELDRNPRASLLFFWKTVNRQVCVEGYAEKISVAESDAYFASRSRESQLARWASQQGQVIDSRVELDHAYQAMEKRFMGNPVPRPPHWGGWRIVPERFEFWQDRLHRLHDRFQYLLIDGKWTIERLAP